MLGLIISACGAPPPNPVQAANETTPTDTVPEVPEGPDGAKLFRQNCAACHTVGKGKLVGPDLMGATEKHDRDWLFAWTRDAGKMIEEGDSVAVALFREWDDILQPPMNHLTDEELEAIFDLLENPVVPTSEPDEE